MIKKISFISFAFLFCQFIQSNSQAATVVNSATMMNVSPTRAATYSAKRLSFSDCGKVYPISNEELFYCALSALNNAGYPILELQYEAATVRFVVNSMEFCLIVSKIDTHDSFIEVIPLNNDYSFPDTIIHHLFDYLDYNYQIVTQTLK